MVKTVKVKDIIIGEGIPKICIPMVGKTMEELIKEANHIKTLSFDVIEWRVDFFEKVDDMEEVKVALTEIRKYHSKCTDYLYVPQCKGRWRKNV